MTDFNSNTSQSTNLLGPWLAYANFFLLMAIFVALLCGASSEQAQSTTSTQQTSSSHHHGPGDGEAVAFILGQDGAMSIRGEKAPGQACSRTKSADSKRCKLFADNTEVLNVYTVTIVESLGSHTYTVNYGGEWGQVCYDDNWVEVPCH